MQIKIIYDEFHPELQDCPCGCYRGDDPTIVINPVLFYQMSEFEQKFWLAHEEGHILLDTDSEVQADAHAFDKLVGTEFKSLKQMVRALDNLLTSDTVQNATRKRMLMKRAEYWDQTH